MPSHSASGATKPKATNDVMWAAAVLALALIVYASVRAFVIEPNHAELVARDVPIPGLDAGLDGFRIVHLSDFHMERYGDKERMVVAAVRDVRPDLLCLTGDYVEKTGRLAVLAPFLMELARGRAAFAVLGNHDHQAAVNLKLLVGAMERAGIRVLINDRATAQGGRIEVVGVDDPHLGRDDLDAALGRPGGSARGERRFTLLLAHSPDIVSRKRATEADLILCGHTHGGQLRAPFLGPIKTNTRIGRKAAAGLVEIDGLRIYVTRGVGESGLRARYACRPEVTVLALRRSD